MPAIQALNDGSIVLGGVGAEGMSLWRAKDACQWARGGAEGERGLTNFADQGLLPCHFFDAAREKAGRLGLHTFPRQRDSSKRAHENGVSDLESE